VGRHRWELKAYAPSLSRGIPGWEQSSAIKCRGEGLAILLLKKCKEGIFIWESKFKSNSDLPLTLNAMDVAEALGISRAVAYTLVQSGSFPHMRIGRRILVPKDAFLRWIAERTEGVNSRL